MTVHPQIAGKRFLSVVTPPEGLARPALAQLIADNTGMDERTARLRLGLVPPLIIGLVDDAAALRAVAAIKSYGGDATAPKMSDIEALGPTLKIRDMEIRGGRVHMELWRGPQLHVAPQEIEIVVRARTPGTAVEPLRYEMATRSFMAGGGGSAFVALGLGGAYGLASVLHQFDDDLDSAAMVGLPVMSKPQIMPSHKLDLHATDGRVLQVDGDKFGFRVLGDLRGLSDNTNIDRMSELFVHLNPDIVVDTYFGAFLPPAGHQRMRLPLMALNNEHIAFAFYSRWSALVYRHVMHGS
jgi:hypothetical protein